MAFLCPSRLGKVKNKRGYYNPMMGRITGSDSIETLVKLELGRQNANNPETRRIILQSFTGCAPEEISVKQGQKVHILFREGDWAYVITHDKKQGYVPFTYCARIGKAPSYRAPKLSKDKEKLLDENDEMDINYEDDDDSLNGIDTTLAEPPDNSCYSEFVSDSFVSDDYSEHQSRVEKENTNPDNEELNIEKNIEDSQYKESVTIVVDDEQHKPHSENVLQQSKTSSLGQSVTINMASGKRPLEANSETKQPNNILTSREKRPEIKKEHNIKTLSPFNTKVPLGRYLVLYDFEGHYEDDAKVKQADIVTVLNMDDSDWFWVKKTDNTEGFVPSNFLFRLGLLLSDSKQVLSCIDESQEAQQSNISTEELNVKANSTDHNSPNGLVQKSMPLENYIKDNLNQNQLVSPKGKESTYNFSKMMKHQNTHETMITKWSANMSSPNMGPVSPRYCNFSFEINQTDNSIDTSMNNSYMYSDSNGVNGLNDQEERQETEELYPPPLEFSNSTEDSYEAFPVTNNQDVAVNDIKNHISPKYNQSSDMKIKAQPNSTNTASQNRHDRKNTPSTNAVYHKQQHSEVRYRTDSNGKRVSKNKARPKSTPPGDMLLQNSQYYMKGNINQHYDTQQGTRVGGHQSERLTPRTNYNYSPTYHSSVWKPYQHTQQLPVYENTAQYEFAKGHSAFEKPKSNRYSMYTFTNFERNVHESMPKSSFPNFGVQEGQHYPSGVYNIRSTMDSVSPKPTAQSAIRKLSDEENQNLFRKLDNIQKSFHVEEQAVQSDGNSDEMGSESNSSKQNTDITSNDRAKIPSNGKGIKSIPSSPLNQKQSLSNSFEKPQFSPQTRKSYKMATQGGNSKTSLAKHIVRSYSPDEVNSKEEMTHPGNHSTIPNGSSTESKPNNVSKTKQTDNQKTYDKSKKPESNILNTEKKQGNTSRQKSPQQTDVHLVNENNKLHQFHFKENGITQMTELISQFDYQATSKADLPLEKGEVVHVSMEEQDNKHWYWAYSPKLRRHGYVPRNYVQVPQITMI